MAYSPQGAICDLIDNSISHGRASKIFVLFQFDEAKDKFDFILYDNGESMDFEGMVNAMKLGSSEEYLSSNVSLGKYGMGLKTASLAFADCLYLLGKCKGSKPELLELNNLLFLAWNKK